MKALAELRKMSPEFLNQLKKLNKALAQLGLQGVDKAENAFEGIIGDLRSVEHDLR